MSKFKTLFNKLNIISESEFDQIADSCDFEINKEGDSLKIDVVFNELISPEIFFKFNNKKNKISNDLIINFNFDNMIFSYDNVHEYLVYYCQNSIDINLTVRNLIMRKSGKIDNDTLYLYYLRHVERDELNNKIENIKIFLLTAGIKFSEIKLVLDEKNKEIELFKNNKLSESIERMRNGSFNKVKANQIIENNSKARKPITGTVEKIGDLIPEQGEAIVQGKVFKTELLSVKNSKNIFKFYITDYTDSILIKSFPSEKNNQTFSFLSSIKEGMWIKAKISLGIDSFEKNDLTGISRDIEIINEPPNFKIEDNAQEKRTEFINHTIMSAFEGVIQPENLINTIKKMGHDTVVVTDKHGCQIFPEIDRLAKKNNLKAIYGFQTNLLETQIPIVLNATDEKIKDSFVVFDIETTGLYPLFNEMIEFGAIKYENGKITERKQFFIKPEKPIPAKITEITRINDETVKNGYSEIDGLLEIKKFIGDLPLIAHNGISFDINFINKKLEKNGMPLIKNILIDTMQVSRSINKDFSSHALGNICKKYKIDYSSSIAHRADFDSEVLLSVWKIMMIELNKLGVKTYNNINEKLQNKSLLEKNRGFLITVYAKGQSSIKSLYKLISRSLTKNFADKPVLFDSDIQEFKQNILISNSPSEGDILYSCIYESQEDLENKMKYYDFITISPPSTYDHEFNRGNMSIDEYKLAINKIIETADKLDIKVIASSDTYYLRKEDEIVYDVYVHTKSIGGKPHRIFSYGDSNDVLPKYYYRSTNEMLREFSFLGDKKAKEIVIDNTNKLKEKFDNKVDVLKMDKLYTPTISNAKENLQELTYRRLKEKYGPNPDESILARIDRELKAIIENGYSVIYWFSHLLVKESNDNGYIVGSRGSVGSSLVATMVGITDVNPLPPHYLCDKCKNFTYVKNTNSGFDLPELECNKCGSKMIGDGHNIPFETFMGFKGDKVPDIDLNFSAEYQAKAHEYIMKTFGYSHTLKAGTIGTVAEKTAYGYVKNYFEMKNIYKTKNAELVRLAGLCENVKRTTGQHPGGIIVVPKDMEPEDFTPINYPADDTSLEWYTTHYAFEFLHDSLLKFDILGHDTPTILRMLENLTGVNSKNIPNNDENVMKMFYDISGIGIEPKNLFNNLVGTNGLPEFGTNFVKEMLTVASPKNFSDLIRISGLSHGTNVWIGNAKDLIEKNNINISEVISCRDDIMVYLIDKGLDSIDAFNIMENARKGKGVSESDIEKMRAKNVPEWYIDSCNKIKYLFPKAHATAYVTIAWKIAWFKYYYPLHFYATFFSIKITVFDLSTIVKGKEKIINTVNSIKSQLASNETKYLVKNKDIELIPIYEMVVEMIERGYSIKNVDINLSQIKDFIIIDNKYLIPPFSTIDGLGEAVAESIVEARKIKPFSSKEDLMNRTKISKTHYKYMEENNILDGLSERDQKSLFG